MHVVGKMSKDIRMGVRKGTVVSFIPTFVWLLFGDSIPVIIFMSFLFFNVFFRDFNMILTILYMSMYLTAGQINDTIQKCSFEHTFTA